MCLSFMQIGQNCYGETLKSYQVHKIMFPKIHKSANPYGPQTTEPFIQILSQHFCDFSLTLKQTCCVCVYALLLFSLSDLAHIQPPQTIDWLSASVYVDSDPFRPPHTPLKHKPTRIKAKEINSHEGAYWFAGSVAIILTSTDKHCIENTDKITKVNYKLQNIVIIN